MGPRTLKEDALARLLSVFAPLRGALNALGARWAQAPRANAPEARIHGSACPLARGFAFPLTDQNEQGGKCPCKKKENVKE